MNEKSAAPSPASSPQSGKYPIDRPCSACSDGDYEMKHHDHDPPFHKGYGPASSPRKDELKCLCHESMVGPYARALELNQACPVHAEKPEGERLGTHEVPGGWYIWKCINCPNRIETSCDFHINLRPICVQCNAEMEPYLGQPIAPEAYSDPGYCLEHMDGGKGITCPECAKVAAPAAPSGEQTNGIHEKFVRETAQEFRSPIYFYECRQTLAQVRMELSTLRRERDQLTNEIEAACKSLRIGHDEETGYEIPMEPEPEYAESFAEACAVFMALIDKTDAQSESQLRELTAEKERIFQAQSTEAANLHVEIDRLRSTVERLREALEGLLLAGQHDGDCDNEYESRACRLHLAAAKKREEFAERQLAELRSEK